MTTIVEHLNNIEAQLKLRDGQSVPELRRILGIHSGSLSRYLERMRIDGRVHISWVVKGKNYVRLHWLGDGPDEERPIGGPVTGKPRVKRIPLDGVTIAKKHFQPGNPFAVLIAQVTA